MILQDCKATTIDFKDATHIYQLATGAAATVTKSTGVQAALASLVAAWTTGSVVTLSISGIQGGAFVSQSFTVSPAIAGALGPFVPPTQNPPWWQEWQGFIFDSNTIITITVTSPGAGNTVSLLALITAR